MGGYRTKWAQLRYTNYIADRAAPRVIIGLGRAMFVCTGKRAKQRTHFARERILFVFTEKRNMDPPRHCIRLNVKICRSVCEIDELVRGGNFYFADLKWNFYVAWTSVIEREQM